MNCQLIKMDYSLNNQHGALAIDNRESGMQLKPFAFEQQFASEGIAVETDAITQNVSAGNHQKDYEKKRGRNTFPWKLHNMLDDAQKDNKQDIVGWEPDGMSFRVLKPKEFEKTIMPRYFNHSSFRSFQRQVSHQDEIPCVQRQHNIVF